MKKIHGVFLGVLLPLLSCLVDSPKYHLSFGQLVIEDVGNSDLSRLKISLEDQKEAWFIVLERISSPLISLEKFPYAEVLSVTPSDRGLSIVHGGKIRSLGLNGRNVKDLTTARELPALEVLHLVDTSLTNLHGLEALRVRKIALTENVALNDFSGLSESTVSTLDVWEADVPQVIANLKKLYPVTPTGEGRYTVDVGGRTIEVTIEWENQEARSPF